MARIISSSKLYLCVVFTVLFVFNFLPQRGRELLDDGTRGLLQINIVIAPWSTYFSSYTVVDREFNYTSRCTKHSC